MTLEPTDEVPAYAGTQKDGVSKPGNLRWLSIGLLPGTSPLFTHKEDSAAPVVGGAIDVGSGTYDPYKEGYVGSFTCTLSSYESRDACDAAAEPKTFEGILVGRPDFQAWTIQATPQNSAGCVDGEPVFQVKEAKDAAAAKGGGVSVNLGTTKTIHQHEVTTGDGAVSGLRFRAEWCNGEGPDSVPKIRFSRAILMSRPPIGQPFTVGEDLGPNPTVAASGGPGAGSRGPKPSCIRPGGVRRVRLSSSKFPAIRASTLAAIARGWPRVLVLNRPGAGKRRDRLLPSGAKKPGFDRFQYPPAIGRGRPNGGLRGLARGTNPLGWFADVTSVRSSENRAHSVQLSSKLARFCNGTRFRYVFR